MAFLDRRSSITIAVIAAALACWTPPAARAEDAPPTDKAGQAASTPADVPASDSGPGRCSGVTTIATGCWTPA